MEGGKAISTYLIAGYVSTVAILFDRAPKTKAAKAERASGDPFPFLICSLFKSLCFS